MRKVIDFLMLVFLPLAAALISFVFKTSFMLSTILMFGLPSLWLVLKHRLPVKKIALFSLIFSIPFTFIIDYFISKDLGWYIVSTIFPFRIFGIITIELFFWGFLYVFFAITYYETFLNRKTKRPSKIITKNMQYAAIFLSVTMFLLIYFAIHYPLTFTIDYAYLVIGTILALISLLLLVTKLPHLINRFFKPILYFTFLAVTNEITSLTLHYWTFPGNHYLGMTKFFSFMIPYEEILFYFILMGPLIFVYYEYFDDDRK